MSFRGKENTNRKSKPYKVAVWYRFRIGKQIFLGRRTFCLPRPALLISYFTKYFLVIWYHRLETFRCPGVFVHDFSSRTQQVREDLSLLTWNKRSCSRQTQDLCLKYPELSIGTLFVVSGLTQKTVPWFTPDYGAPSLGKHLLNRKSCTVPPDFRSSEGRDVSLPKIP